MSGVRFPAREEISLALRPSQPPIQSVPGSLPRRQSVRGVKLTANIRVVSTLQVRGILPPLPHTSLWRGA